MKKAAIYSRKSKFTGKGESIETQIELCKKYAYNIGITQFLIYEDEGFSGKNIDRPQFKKMIKDAHEKKFDTLICYRLDRISRNIADFSTLINELDRLEINFISINEQFDTSTPIGRAMMYIASVFAQLERETIGERIRDNMLELSKSGRWLGGQTPLGFESTSTTITDEFGRNKKIYFLTPIESELTTVKLIYSKYIEFKSLSKVYKYLYIRNIRTKNGYNWTKKKIQLILKNPLYVKADYTVMQYLSNQGMITCGQPDGLHGILTYNKSRGNKIYRNINEWIAAISMHKGIINANDWLKVQTILNINKSKAPRMGTSHTASLTGILKCHYCGANMIVKHGHISKKTGKKLLYYVCSCKDISNGKKCSNKNVRVDELEYEVIKKLNDIKINRNMLISLLEKYISYQKCNYNNENLNNLKYIKEKQKQIDNLITQLSKEPSLSEYIIPKIYHIKSEIDYLNTQNNNISQNKFKETILSTNENVLFNRICSLKYIFDICDINDKKKLFKSLIKEITWDGNSGTVKIKLKEDMKITF